jgi:hypothetical protein
MKRKKWLSKRLISGVVVSVILVLTSCVALRTTLVVTASSPPPGIEWEKTYGGINFEEAWSVHQTADGGYVLVGQGPSLIAGDADVYLIKTDALGNMEWERTIGGTDAEVGYSIDQTTDGGYIIAGKTKSYGAGLFDAYLVKTDASGNTEWEKAFGGYYNDIAECVEQTEDGGYIIAGMTASQGAGLNDFYLIKTDALGDIEWVKNFGGYADDIAYSVQQTADNGYIIAGYTESYGAGDTDFYLVKTDALGNEEWEKTFGGNDAEVAYSIGQTADGGYILTGQTYSYDVGGGDIYLVKTNNTGTREWEQIYGGAGQDIAESVQQTTDGGYILAGFTDSSGAGATDVYLLRTDALGNVEWEQTVGGSGYEKARYVRQTTDGGFISAGQTSSYGAGGWDAYLVKLSSEVPPIPPIAVAGGPYLVQIDYSVDLDGSTSYDPDGTIVTYDWNFGDNTTGTGAVVAHTYSAVGIYSVELTVTDDSSVQASDTTMVVVYDPVSGSATGGGWFWSGQGNLRNDPASEGKATFGFVVKYKHDVADGNLEFQYHVGDINLKSTGITWLSVSSPNANFQGESTINGEGLFTFRVLAEDGDKAGGQPDEFTIRIWQGTDTEADPIYQAIHAELGGGNIIIHDN